MRQWRSSGSHTFYHHGYGTELEVSYALIEDLSHYDSYGTLVGSPILVFHGLGDAKVDYHQSIRYASERDNVHLILLDSNHELMEQLPAIWAALVQFFDLCAFHPRRMHVAIRAYDLADIGDVAQFKPYQDRFLDILELSYEDRSIGPDRHLERIYGEKHTVFLAFAGAIDTQSLVGCSYMRPDGKRSAMAVLPSYQGRGIARELICASLKLFPDQFTEIRVSSNQLRNLLVSCGFRPVASEKALKRLLGANVSRLCSIRHLGNEMIYVRRSEILPEIVHEFIMFEYHANESLGGLVR